MFAGSDSQANAVDHVMDPTLRLRAEHGLKVSDRTGPSPASGYSDSSDRFDQLEGLITRLLANHVSEDPVQEADVVTKCLAVISDVGWMGRRG